MKVWLGNLKQFLCNINFNQLQFVWLKTGCVLPFWQKSHKKTERNPLEWWDKKKTKNKTLKSPIIKLPVVMILSCVSGMIWNGVESWKEKDFFNLRDVCNECNKMQRKAVKTQTRKRKDTWLFCVSVVVTGVSVPLPCSASVCDCFAWENGL